MATLKTMLMMGLMVGATYTITWMGLDWLLSTRTQDYATIFSVAFGAAALTVWVRETD